MNRREFIGASALALAAPTVGLSHIERMRELRLFSCLNRMHCQRHYVIAYSLDDAKSVLTAFYTCPDHPDDEWEEHQSHEMIGISFVVGPHHTSISRSASDWCKVPLDIGFRMRDERTVGGKRGVIWTTECAPEYHLFNNGTDICVALSEKDAEEWYYRETGVTKEEYEDHEWTRIPDDKKITIFDLENYDHQDEPRPVTKTAGEWCREAARRCVIASTEW